MKKPQVPLFTAVNFTRINTQVREFTYLPGVTAMINALPGRKIDTPHGTTCVTDIKPVYQPLLGLDSRDRRGNAIDELGMLIMSLRSCAGRTANGFPNQFTCTCIDNVNSVAQPVIFVTQVLTDTCSSLGIPTAVIASGEYHHIPG